MGRKQKLKKEKKVSKLQQKLQQEAGAERMAAASAACAAYVEENLGDRVAAEGRALRLSCCDGGSCEDADFERIMAVMDENMREYYETSAWGWSAEAKAEELRHPSARLLLVHEEGTGALAAFAHLRFDWDDDEAMERTVLYCYEVQVAEGFRRLGIGQSLMAVMEALAAQFQMPQVMLTVFKHNAGALRFYDKLGYAVDRSSPSRFGEAADYEIFSKAVGP